MVAQSQQQPSSGTSQFNAMAFLVRQMISRVNVATMVQVLAVTNAGGVSPIGTVDVQILVNQVDGAGQPVPHVTVYGLPYIRVQGGTNAVILDPKVGDIGLAVFAHSDISTVKATGAQANPGSGRRNSIADGMYVYTVMSATPVNYVQFINNDINVFATGAMNLTATGGHVSITASSDEVDITSSGQTHIVASGGCNIDANTVVNGHFTVNGDTTLNGILSQGAGGSGSTASLIGPLTVTNNVTAQGTSLHTHTHPDPQGGNTGPPN